MRLLLPRHLVSDLLKADVKAYERHQANGKIVQVGPYRSHRKPDSEFAQGNLFRSATKAAIRPPAQPQSESKPEETRQAWEDIFKAWCDSARSEDGTHKKPNPTSTRAAL
jgi:hypothetical protein